LNLPVSAELRKTAARLNNEKHLLEASSPESTHTEAITCRFLV